MDRRLLEPRWLIAHLLVVAVAILFVFLGFWQLDRLGQRRVENAVGERRITSAPEQLDTLLSSTDDLESLRFRRVTASGTFDPGNEALIRSQVRRGTAGFHVITPLVVEDGDAVLVNRGWVPLTMDTVPVTEASPPTGVVTVEGWIEKTQQRPPLGPEDPPEGRLETLNRVDIKRISQQVPMSLAPVYIVAIGDQGTDLPVPVDQPEFADLGPHLAYAIQWFGFATVAVVGYFFLARRRLRDSG